jgi:alpha-N-acetylglucosaminidase
VWPARAPAKERLLSLDVHRGLCVIAMMLVDWTGTWDGRYAVFEHANWLGVTLPDFIFPSFLFIAGVAIAVSIDRDAPPGRLWRRVLRRSLLLFACGLALNVFWDWEPGVPLLPKLRIMGVLQRYALVYPAGGGAPPGAVAAAADDDRGRHPRRLLAAGGVRAGARLRGAGPHHQPARAGR